MEYHLNSSSGKGTASRILLLFAFFLGINLISADKETAGRSIQPCPQDQWNLVSKTGDSVKLSAQGDVLTIKYDVNVQDSHRVGHQLFKQGMFRLLLKEPMALRDDEARVLFESAGQDETTVLCPMIRDEGGEIFIYEPRASDALEATKSKSDKNAKKMKWASWYSNQFQVTEAGGATQNIYEAEGSGNAFPDGKLTFLGFEAKVYMNQSRKDAGKRQGVLILGKIGTAGVLVPQGDPFFFADSLMTAKGRYRIAMEIRDRFQGPTFHESFTEMDFNPDDPQSCRQKIVFPVGAVKNSWIGCRVNDENNSIVSSGTYRWEKNLPPAAQKAPPTDFSKKAPAIGLMRLNPDKHTDGIYQPTESAEILVRIFPSAKISGTAVLKWELLPYSYKNSLGKGEMSVTVNPPFSDTVIKAPITADRNAYVLKLSLSSDGKVLDDQEYVFGFAKNEPYTSRVGKLTDRDLIKSSAYMRVSYLYGDTPAKAEDEAVKHFCQVLEESGPMASNITYMIDLADFEILPGVFDFAVLDRVMDEAADRGRKLTIRLGHSQQVSPYRWLNYTRPRNFDGTPIPGHKYYGAFDHSDPEFANAWMRAFKMLYDRYGKHPAFQGYYIMQPSGEFTPDVPWEGLVSCYSWSSAEAFRKFLKERYGDSLEKLNAKWNSKYSDWKQINPPQPTWNKAKEPDLRPEWVDFSRFKNNLFESWFPETGRYIRSFDPDHIIIDYGGHKLNGEADERLFGNVDYLHNGGNHFLQGENALVNAWDNKLGWITEPHHPHRWAAYGDPSGKGWVLDWSVFVMTAQAGGGGANLHVYYMPKPMSLTAHYGGAFAYDRFEKYAPIVNELHGIKLLESPKQIAVIQDELSLLTKHRTTFVPRLADLGRWFELLKADAIDYEWMRSANLKNYKLLVLNPIDEVLSRENIDTVDRLVRDGAYAIINARTGRVCPDMPGQDYALLQKLGLPVPAGTYVQNQPAAKAKVSGENPFFKDGTEIAFVSQTDIAREEQDPSLEFWKWPYRWIPHSDYFGYYQNNKLDKGQVIARFPDGGAAMSLHELGKGKMLVMWGTPDMKTNLLKGFMTNASKWADVKSPRAGSAIPLMLEGDHKVMKRHYVLLYNDTPGEYVQKIPGAPDGRWFIDEMVSDQKLGVYTGEELRRDGIKLLYIEGCSPLKILRMIPEDQIQADWSKKYRMPTK